MEKRKKIYATRARPLSKGNHPNLRLFRDAVGHVDEIAKTIDRP